MHLDRLSLAVHCQQSAWGLSAKCVESVLLFLLSVPTVRVRFLSQLFCHPRI